MKCIKEVLSLSTEYLSKRGIASAKRDAEDLLSDALAMNRLDLYINADLPLSVDELAKCRDYVQRRGKGEPGAYIHGSVEFYRCYIQVNPSVLIPRPETEILVDKIADHLKSYNDLHLRTLWDICTGSGCIGISLKKKFPELNVILSDISLEALRLAKENALQNEVEVSFVQGDLLAPFSGRKADFIVSNPPYITLGDYENLDPAVKNYEPALALAAGEDGLQFYKRFANGLADHLNPSGCVWFELGTSQGEAVKELFKKFRFKKCVVEQDWSGHDRFFFLEME